MKCTSVIGVLLPAAVVAMLVFTGCVSIDQTIYLQDLKVNGAFPQPPLHLNNGPKSQKVAITPYYTVNTRQSLNGRIDGHSLVNANGVYQVDTIRNGQGAVTGFSPSGNNSYPFQGRNLKWNLADNSYGVDIDFKIADSWALSAGLNYSTLGSQSFGGGNLGVGIMFGDSDIAGRLEGGVRLQTISYEAVSAVVTSYSMLFTADQNPTVNFFEDRATDSHVNFYASVTLNTTLKSLMNGFVQAAICNQTLADYQPYEYLAPVIPINYQRTDTRTQNSASFMILTPGLIWRLSEKARLHTGARFVFTNGIEFSDMDWTVMPVAQFEIGF